MRFAASLLVLMFIPAASAGSVPLVGFLVDGESGPVGEGAVSSEYPDSNESMVRLITLDAGQGPSTVFKLSDHPGTHIKGPLFAGLWVDPLAGQDGELLASIQIDGTEVATASIDVAFDPENMPDPEQFVPPDPTDPEGTVWYEVGQAMPYIFQPPVVLDLGVHDIEVPEGSELSISLSLSMPASPVPTGLATTMKYDGVLTPSFLYIPYWSADPDAQAPQLPPPETQPAQPDDGAGGSGGSADDGDDDGPAKIDGKDSPGVGLIVLLGSVAAVAWARRR